MIAFLPHFEIDELKIIQEKTFLILKIDVNYGMY